MKRIKQLQDDSTTPEQSRRLLELGLPQDSANIGIIEDAMYTYKEILSEPFSRWSHGYENISLPCWSVGRLIEIELKSREKRNGYIARLYFTAEDNPIDADTIGQSNIIEELIRYMESALYRYDFSRLEEKGIVEE